jgi:acetyl esterase/lipase
MAKTPAELVMMPVVYTLPGMEQARVTSNLKYTDTDNPHLLMDVYSPGDSGAGDRRGVVILLHGGAAPEYRPKDWGVFQSWGRLIAAAGMVGVAFTHRMRYPVPHLEEASSDVRSALDYVRANGASWNADPDRMCLVAFSAAGPLLAAALRERPPFVRCMAAFYSILAQESGEYSPLAALESGTVPLFVARAGKDVVPGLNVVLDKFVAAALAANAPLTLMNHPLGEHGFDSQNDDERSREIIRAAIEFMKTHLAE